VSFFAINAIYRATEGEGIHVGSPQVFVRFQGCSVGCVNCDSIDTWDFSAGERLNLEQVLTRIEAEGGQLLKRVSITGGDPLHPKLLPQVLELSQVLKRRGYWLNLEAAGTRVVDELFDILDFVSFDYKTPSTGVRTQPALIARLAVQYPKKFQIKAVIENRADFDDTLKAREFVQEMLRKDRLEVETFPWVLTPAFNLGESLPFERVANINQWNEESGSGFRVILQQHKVIHGSEKKKV
jgi:7-carboxy-7-deazaguanine synthase